MSRLPIMNYKTESNRYRYYYRRLIALYQKPVTQVSTAVLFTIGLIIFFAIFAIKPTLETIAELIKKIESQELVLAQAQKKTTALAAAQERLIAIEPALPILDQAIPDNYQIQNVLRSIEATAGSMGLSINNLRVSNVVYPPATSTNPIEEISLNIAFETTYPEAKQLIVALNKLPRLLTLDSISITKSELNSRQAATADVISVNLQSRIYYAPQAKGGVQ